MIISSLEWASNSCDEAIVVISGGKTNVSVFSHPYTRSVGDLISESLHPIDVRAIRLACDTKAYAYRHLGSLAYDCCGVLSNKALGLIDVDGIILEIEEKLPDDLKNGDLIEFSCDRIDLW